MQIFWLNCTALSWEPIQDTYYNDTSKVATASVSPQLASGTSGFCWTFVIMRDSRQYHPATTTTSVPRQTSGVVVPITTPAPIVLPPQEEYDRRTLAIAVGATTVGLFVLLLVVLVWRWYYRKRLKKTRPAAVAPIAGLQQIHQGNRPRFMAVSACRQQQAEELQTLFRKAGDSILQHKRNL